MEYNILSNIEKLFLRTCCYFPPKKKRVPSKENILDTRGEEYLVTTMNELFRIFKQKDAQDCKKFWYNFMKQNKLETNLTKLGIESKDDISKIINNIDTIRIINNPIKVDKKIVENIFNSLT